MSSRVLLSYFSGEIAATQVKQEIAEELRRCRGTVMDSRRTRISDDEEKSDFLFPVRREQLQKLFEDYDQGLFDEDDVNFIALSLEFSNHFELSDDEVAQIISDLAGSGTFPNLDERSLIRIRKAFSGPGKSGSNGVSS